MNGISATRDRRREDSHLQTRKGSLTRAESAGTLILNFPDSETVRNKCCWLF